MATVLTNQQRGFTVGSGKLPPVKRNKYKENEVVSSACFPNGSHPYGSYRVWWWWRWRWRWGRFYASSGNTTYYYHLHCASGFDEWRMRNAHANS